MIRYFEYTDENGKRWGSRQNAVDASRATANRLLAETARMSRWKDVAVFPQEMPEWEIKKRINAIQEKNGNPPIYTEEQTTDPALRKVVSVPSIILTDHADGSTIDTPILATSEEKVTTLPAFAPEAAQPVAIVDHAEESRG